MRFVHSFPTDLEVISVAISLGTCNFKPLDFIAISIHCDGDSAIWASKGLPETGADLWGGLGNFREVQGTSGEVWETSEEPLEKSS